MPQTKEERKPYWQTKEERKTYWRHVWSTALHNMPGKKTTRYTQWEPVAPGTVSVPDFIKKRTEKLMIEIDGHFFQRTGYTSCYDQMAVLRVMLGEIHSPFGGFMGEVKRGFYRGVRPKDPKRRKRLILLGTPKGRELAWKYLKFVGKDHLYINPEQAATEVKK